jgi:antitoxin component YwqK of YwqJK toxin-antitoxin module
MIKRVVLMGLILGTFAAVMRAAEAPVVDGVVKRSYPSGELMSELHYLNGKLDGLSIDYYKSGQIMYEWNYRNNKLHGVSRAYTIDGHLMSEWDYKHGVLHGTSVEYHPNRKKKKVEKYRNGQVVKRRLYDEKGKLIERFDAAKK